MNPVRKRRLVLVGLLLLAAAVATTFIVLALQANLSYLHTPTEVREGEAPTSGKMPSSAASSSASISDSRPSSGSTQFAPQLLVCIAAPFFIASATSFGM